MKALTFVDGMVTSVEQTDGKTLIGIGGVKVPWDTVSTVRLAAEEADEAEEAGDDTAATDTTATDTAANETAADDGGPNVTFREDGSMVTPFDDA